jgi:bisphosphoglycerate-dependent phosphoglycerate mutase
MKKLLLLRHGESTWNKGEPVHGLDRCAAFGKRY